MNLCKTATASLVLLLTASTALANSSIGLSAYGVETDEARSAEEGVGFRFNFGWGAYDHLRWELQYAQDTLETGTGAGTDFYQAHLGFDVAWRFNTPQQWQPYLLIGLGAVYDDVTPDSADDTNAFVNAGLGLLTPPLAKNNIRLRFDARYVHSEFVDGFQDVHYGVGLEFPLWQERVVEVERIVEKVVYRDVPVVQPASAPLDSDADGVADASDRCPATLAGAQVDAQGCVVQKQVIVLHGIQFASDSARLLSGSEKQINAVAKAMKSQPSMRVEIAGHTDASGGYAHNQTLSDRRANAVRSRLVALGVEAYRLRAKGYGESSPVASNESLAGRAQNRRVEFRVIGE